MSFIKKEPREMLTSKGAKPAAGLKRGFGIVEVLVAAAVLGFLYVAVLNLQSGNRESLLRIRGRDGATEVAQNIIDSLKSIGLASLSDEKLTDASGEIAPIKINGIKRTWKAQPGTIQYDMTVTYDATVIVSRDSLYTAKSGSQYDSASHMFAKRLDVKVSWPFKNSIQSINVSGVIR
jgi:type II secretory pathway pseudopilin PulG